ncbi:hypothetical protein V5799_004096 [Amblyomma americanum]|uniref:Uncharacterized protein n=1 Tax=Amblyomma americanum TaxID=6943 RepID=A0AAQ4D733_AMBAM
MHGERVPIVLVGNKSDLIAKRQVSQDMAMKLAQESMHNCQYLETSAKYNVNVSELFVELLQQAFTMERQPAPAADRPPDPPLLQPQQNKPPSRKLSHRLSFLGNLPSLRRKSSAASTAGGAGGGAAAPSTPRSRKSSKAATVPGQKCHIL